MPTKEIRKAMIIAECEKFGIVKPEQVQYVMATVEHETAGTFEPVREAFWLRNYTRYLKSKEYYPYYGRGFVQLTWKENYEKFSTILGVDLVAEPDLALKFEYALKILLYGMLNGTFTGKKLDDYINHKGTDFIGARAIINGRDKAKHIASLAQKHRVVYDAVIIA